MDTYKVYIDLPSNRDITMPIGGDFYTMDSAIRFVKEMQFTADAIDIEHEFYKGGVKFIESFLLDDDYNIIQTYEGE
jgi:hypothetical protein